MKEKREEKMPRLDDADPRRPRRPPPVDRSQFRVQPVLRFFVFFFCFFVLNRRPKVSSA